MKNTAQSVAKTKIQTVKAAKKESGPANPCLKENWFISTKGGNSQYAYVVLSLQGNDGGVEVEVHEDVLKWEKDAARDHALNLLWTSCYNFSHGVCAEELEKAEDALCDAQDVEEADPSDKNIEARQNRETEEVVAQVFFDMGDELSFAFKDELGEKVFESFVNAVDEAGALVFKDGSSMGRFDVSYHTDDVDEEDQDEEKEAA